MYSVLTHLDVDHVVAAALALRTPTHEAGAADVLDRVRQPDQLHLAAPQLVRGDEAGQLPRVADSVLVEGGEAGHLGRDDQLGLVGDLLAAEADRQLEEDELQQPPEDARLLHHEAAEVGAQLRHGDHVDLRLQMEDTSVGRAQSARTAE